MTHDVIEDEGGIEHDDGVIESSEIRVFASESSESTGYQPLPDDLISSYNPRDLEARTKF